MALFRTFIESSWSAPSKYKSVPKIFKSIMTKTTLLVNTTKSKKLLGNFLKVVYKIICSLEGCQID